MKAHKQELFLCQVKLRSLHQLLSSECPKFTETKCGIVGELLIPYHLEVARKSYATLMNDLIDCRRNNLQKARNQSSTTASKYITVTALKVVPNPTTAVTTTTTAVSKLATMPPQLFECLTATNLTQSWRLDHEGSDIRPGGPHSYDGYACDFHKNLQWFRFSGEGGKCSAHFSCKQHMSS